MRTVGIPPAVPPAASGNLSDLVLDWEREDPSAACVSRKDATGAWVDVSVAEFAATARAVAKGLLAAGVRPGDRVGLMSRTRYEWTVVDAACWFTGAVGVPVYDTSSPEQVQWILSDSAAVACVVESAEHAALLTGVREQVPSLREVWTVEDGALEQLAAAGAGVGEQELEAARTSAGPSSTATIVYTSGSTGRPKGCVLTHANFVDLVRNAHAVMPDMLDEPGASTLLFIPLAHVLARFVEVLCLSTRVRVGFAPDTRELVADLQGFRPTFVLAVPRVFQKVHDAAQNKAAAGGKLKAGIFARAEATAVAYSRALDAGGPGRRLRAQHALFDHLVYAKLRTTLGGRLTRAVSGGASLGEHLNHFFRGAGLTVFEGYGLTETAAPACVNRPGDQHIGSVGLPLPGTEVAVAEDGEILVRGIGVFREYLNRPEETAAAFRDGWFRTGDLGALDAAGNLTITGRAKEILVTAAGKNVAPAPLEDRLRTHPLISQAVVVGDGRAYVACLLTLDEQALTAWGQLHGRPGLSLTAARQDPAVLAELQGAVDHANASVSRAESIRRFRVLGQDFTVGNGCLTPSLKVRRAEVLRTFAAEEEALYT
ncbi:AMP-dependent synthetase/ligase [Kineococcus indalonis]|uniref:AMP-dependent synthetase/ligase n=1 Tax=Kineococcus indalonis TaxID=2696566 RepID=UPI001412A1D6|nr:AMP-binding protein [Kineococcus indalonis]